MAPRRRTTVPGRGRRAWIGTALPGLALLILLQTPGLTAQESRPDCRCVDRNGNEIESCTCVRTFEPGHFFSLQGAERRARIGIMVSTEQHARYDREGVHVEEVLEGGPADEAGLRKGDVIVRVDGRSVFDALDDREEERHLDLDASVTTQRFLALMEDVEPGEEVEIDYLRDGEERRTVVVAEESPGFRPRARVWTFGPEGRSLRHLDELDDLRERLNHELGGDFDARVWRFEGEGPGSAFSLRTDPCLTGSASGSMRVLLVGGSCVDGVELEDLNPELGEYFGTEEGVLVTEVREGSTLGLRPGDVLLAIGDRDVESPEDARRILTSYRSDEDVVFRIVRRGEEMEVTGRRR